ncbi:MAG: hypothetical protein NPIRA05_04430 [Nitrospirales bacterium]|nr:MAG: hypothetical protein NPIRA05_04430 [Nitrospirales bacterium]
MKQPESLCDDEQVASGTDDDRDYGHNDDLEDLRARSAESELEDRGFRNVDSFKSGTTAYSIWYKGRTGRCLQMVTANGRADSIVDIRTHVACR